MSVAVALKAQTQSSIVEFSNAEEVTNKSNELLYNFFNTANIAVNQARNPHLLELMRLIVDNAGKIKFRKNQLTFSRYRYKVQEIKNFHRFVVFVSEAISTSKRHYNEMLGMDVPFVTVSHDEWDSKNRNILGCSIHFIHPLYWSLVSIPIGLKLVDSKKSVDVANQLRRILVR